MASTFLLAMLLFLVSVSAHPLLEENRHANHSDVPPADTQCTFPLKAMKSFDPAKFHGTWYWDSTTDVYSASISCDREKFHFSTKVNHHGQRSDHLHIDEEYWYGGDHQHHIGAWVKTLDPRQRAKYHGKYTHYGPGLQEINFWFIATDYEKYALVYICHHHFAARVQNEAIALSTSPHGLTDAQRKKLQNIIDRSNLGNTLKKVATSPCGPH